MWELFASVETKKSTILASEFVRRSLSQRPVRTTLIVFPPPSPDDLLCLAQTGEPMRVEALRPEGPIKGFHVRLSVGLPGREKSIRTPF